MMKGWIEVTSIEGKEKLSIQVIHIEVFNEIYIGFAGDRQSSIRVKETYEEIKQKIKEASDE